MKIKTIELEGAALDWAVARATKYEDHVYTDGGGELRHGVIAYRWSPSTDWTQGGPLIAEKITVLVDCKAGCYADTWNDAGIYGQAFSEFDGHGPTALIAAMRAIVASELGNEVDVPEELAGGAR